MNTKKELHSHGMDAYPDHPASTAFIEIAVAVPFVTPSTHIVKEKIKPRNTAIWHRMYQSS